MNATVRLVLVDQRLGGTVGLAGHIADLSDDLVYTEGALVAELSQ
jgi:hypothetical protein